jgi:hypothetical protein
MYTNNLFTLNNIPTATFPGGSVNLYGPEANLCGVGVNSNHSAVASSYGSDVAAFAAAGRCGCVGKSNRATAPMENRPVEGFQIHYSDKMFVRVVQYGRVLLDKLYVGVGSMAELMADVKRQLSTTCGLVTVNVRNGSQGWARKNCVRLNCQRMSFPQMA